MFNAHASKQSLKGRHRIIHRAKIAVLLDNFVGKELKVRFLECWKSLLLDAILNLRKGVSFKEGGREKKRKEEVVRAARRSCQSPGRSQTYTS